MAAGQAEGINVWNLDKDPVNAAPYDTFLPTTTNDGTISK